MYFCIVKVWNNDDLQIYLVTVLVICALRTKIKKGEPEKTNGKNRGMSINIKNSTRPKAPANQTADRLK
jgi:hypothetical protein